MKKTFYTYWPVLIFLFFFVGVFYKVFLFGLLPFPGDLLVSRFSPYKSGDWTGYEQWVTHKEFIAADVVRQIYPWRLLAIEQFKDGQIPLWNPYAFAGTPLLANVQSAVFYPFNVLFFVFHPILAWVMYILLQPLLAYCGMYLFIRSLSLSKYAAVFGGISFASIGYLGVWLELGIVGHTAIWLPFILWGITKYTKEKNIIFLLVSTLGLTLSLLAGHMQTAVYVYIISFIYFCFVTLPRYSWKDLLQLWFIFLAFGIAAVQLIPSLELLQYSARNGETSKDIFFQFQLPLKHLITIFAPDFFGNPATNNYWGRDYGEFITYFGIVALVFAMIGITQVKQRVVRFFVVVGIISLLFALPTFLSELLTILQVPVLGTSNPARAIFIFQFSLVVVGAYGIEEVFIKKRLPLKLLLVLFFIYVCIWVGVFIGKIIDTTLVTELAITQRNLILPTTLFIVTIVTMVLFKKTKKNFLFLLLIMLMTYEYQYFLYKYSPFAPASYIFPQHPLITYLQKESPPHRVFAYDSTHFETNLSTQWHLQNPDGYDPLYIKRYGELINASGKGIFTSVIPRSDATLPESLPINDSYPKQVVMNMLSVLYAADRDDNQRLIYELQPWRFPSDRYVLFWQQGKWKVYKNLKAMPRASIFYNAEVVTNDKEIIEKLFDQKFPYQETLILEENPPLRLTKKTPTSAKVISYKPNEVIIEGTTTQAGLLFLADNYYPGWKAYVDGKETKIYRTNYTFRAVIFPQGKHTVRFSYQPESFRLGAVTSIISLGIFISIAGVSFYKKRLHN